MSTVYKYIQNDQPVNALSYLNTLTESDSEELFTLFEGKNCIDLLSEKNWDDQWKKLLNKIISIAEQSKLLKGELFFKTIKNKKISNFYHLIDAHSHLFKQKEEIKKCMTELLKMKDSIEACRKILLTLNSRDIEIITNGSPSILELSIRENQPYIFFEFLFLIAKSFSRLFEIKCQNGGNILHAIANYDSSDQFFQMLKMNEDLFAKAFSHINDQDKNGQTALHLAALKGNKILTKHFINMGASIEIQNTDKKNSYDFAKNEEIKKIIKKAAFGFIKSAKGIPPGMLKEIQEKQRLSLVAFCSFGDFSSAKTLIEKYHVNPLVVHNHCSLPMLALFPSKCDEKSLENLPDHIRETIKEYKNYSEEKKNDLVIDFIQFLHKRKEIDFKHLTEHQNNLLMLSIEANLTKLALYLLKNHADSLDLNQKNMRGDTALTIAIQHKNLKVLEALIKSNKLDLKKNNQKNALFKMQNRQTILHNIAKSNDLIKLFKALINHKDLLPEIFAHIDDQDENGQTALHLSAKHGNKKLTQQLIELGADCYIEDNKKRVPLQMKDSDPLEVENSDTLQILKNAYRGFIKPSKDCPVNLVQKIQRRQEKGLRYLCEKRNLSEAKALIENCDVDPLITYNGFSLPQIILLGESFNFDYFYDSLIKKLERDRNISKHINCKEFIQFIQFLHLRKAINLNHLDDSQSNLLMLSIAAGLTELSLYLLENYADSINLNQKNKYGDTALSIAIRLGNPRVIIEGLKKITKIDPECTICSTQKF